MALSQPRNGTTREEKYLAASCDETNRTPEEDHSQIAGACTISRAECREKNLSAPSRGGDISLDIPLYRTASAVPSDAKSTRLQPLWAWPWTSHTDLQPMAEDGSDRGKRPSLADIYCTFHTMDSYGIKE